MKVKKVIFLIIVAVLVLLNIGIALIIKDARLVSQRHDFIESNNAKLDALNTFNEKLGQNVDDTSLKMLYDSLSLMEKLYLKDGNAKTNAEYKELIDIGWLLIKDAEAGKNISTQELKNKQDNWYTLVKQSQAELENKIITYRFK